MKIYSKRHPKNPYIGVTGTVTMLPPHGLDHIKMPIIPDSLWDMKPIDPACFAKTVNVSAVDIEETVDALKQGIIDRKKFFDQLMDVNFQLMNNLK